MANNPPELHHFPSTFSLKAIGRSNTGFETLVLSIIQKYVPDFGPDDMTSRLSRDGNYQSITLSFFAQDKQQVEELFHELSSHEQVLMVL